MKNGKTLFSHKVLWAAWMRIEDWYRKGNLAPQPELSTWKLHPEWQLRELQKELTGGEWKPSRWPLVPYPKKGRMLRHYYMPTVKDQVAFMAHLVLLGPLLDSKFHNFSFGNRWHRPIAWDRRAKHPEWKHRPYQLYNRHSYRPYARSHGLYRRVANWTVSRMVNAEIRSKDYSGSVQTPDDYPEQQLPEWTKKRWWKSSDASKYERAHWATLDLKLAFPSVQLCLLRNALSNILKSEFDDEGLNSILGGYPYLLQKELEKDETRLEIGESLMDALCAVNADKKAGEIPENAWKPPHTKHMKLPPDNRGLPTGLAVSGLLLNVVLHPADQQILEFLEKRRENERSAFLRFADDMIVLSRSDVGLFALVDEIWRVIAQNTEACVANQDSKSNLQLNIGKIEPKGVSKVVSRYLKNHKWKECDESKVLVAPDAVASPNSLTTWWAEYQQGDDKAERKKLKDGLNRYTVGADEMGPFVTAVVERLSELGKDTLDERFGEGAKNRLDRLHELARLDIDDQQVRPDTRRSFAANRLVAAWLPGDDDVVERDIKEIRDSIAYVLQQTPWKASLWRAVVRAASRRPLRAQDEDYDKQARDWMVQMLGRIAQVADNGRDDSSFKPNTWGVTWPESGAKEHHGRDPTWRTLSLSFHRAVFWNVLATQIAYLRRHHERIANPRVGFAGPSPLSWAVRAIPEGSHDQVADFLADLDQWVEVLYAVGTNDECLPDCKLEIDQFVLAVLSTIDRSSLAEQWSHSKQPGDALLVPSNTVPPKLIKTLTVLEKLNRLQPSDKVPRNLRRSTLSLIRLGRSDDSLSEFLLRTGAHTKTSNSRLRSRLAMLWISLGCSDSIPVSLLSQVVARPNVLVKRVLSDPLALKEYGNARSILMSRPDGIASWNSEHATLHRLLWGVDSCQENLGRWTPKPSELPAVGLTVLLAAKLFVESQSDSDASVLDLAQGPHNWVLSDKHDSLALGRQLQFFNTAAPAQQLCCPKVECKTEWEVPPHPAYYLPFVAVMDADNINAESYAVYCNVLLLLTALDGGEALPHSLAKNGTGSVPFEDRWGWRSRIHLPMEAWKYIEKVLRWAQSPRMSLANESTGLHKSIDSLVPKRLTIDCLYEERIDIRLDPKFDLEIARTVKPQGSSEAVIPDKLKLDPAKLTEDMVVRICQVKPWPDRSEVVESFPVFESGNASQAMEQIENAFVSRHREAGFKKPELVLIPEVSVPYPEAWTVRKLAEEKGYASLAGFYWRELAPAYPAKHSRCNRRWFVNEAELVIPIGHDEPGPTSSRWFTVRKPFPAHVETGLARALSNGSNDTSWNMLRGRRWHRFLHPQWGDFSVAICSDLIEVVPWQALRGQLMHLFMVSSNKDVDLFQALTWVRAYETYVNLVAVNHGKYGGSFLWTPRRKHERELARFRGKHIFVLADVEIPVKDLATAQQSGVETAIASAKCDWINSPTEKSDFKAPPPEFQRLCVVDHNRG